MSMNFSRDQAGPGTNPSGSRAADLMAVVLARQLHDGERVFHGVASPLPMVAILLAKTLHAPHLVYLNITGSVDPTPIRLTRSTAGPALLAGSATLVTLAELFDLSARGALDTAFLSGVQIDGSGRINMSVIGDFAKPTVRLPGGAGSGLILATARRTILWRTQHSPRSLVDRLDFVTAAGNTDCLVTPLCLFRITGEGNQRCFRLEALMPGASLDALRGQTGFTFEAEDPAPVLTPPSDEELATLDEIDPERVRDVEFR